MLHCGVQQSDSVPYTQIYILFQILFCYRLLRAVLCLVTQLCPALCDAMDCNPPGSSVHGILQQECWSGLPFPSPGDLPDPGVDPVSLMSPASAGGFFTTSATWEPHYRGVADTQTVHPECSTTSSATYQPHNLRKLLTHVFPSLVRVLCVPLSHV